VASKPLEEAVSETGRDYSKYYIPRGKEPLCQTLNELLDAMLAQLRKLERDAKNRRVPKRIRSRINEQHVRLAKKLSREKISFGLEVLREAAAEGDIRITFKQANDGHEVPRDRMHWQTNDGFEELRDATRGDLPNGVYLVETTERVRWLGTRPWERAGSRKFAPGDTEPLAPDQPAPEQTAKFIKTDSAGGGATAKKEPIRNATTADLDRCIKDFAANTKDGKTNRDTVRDKGPAWLLEQGIRTTGSALVSRFGDKEHDDKRRPRGMREGRKP
jgi:hypothetical protein